MKRRLVKALSIAAGLTITLGALAYAAVLMMLPGAIVYAPNHGKSAADLSTRISSPPPDAKVVQFRVGPPSATLSAYLLDPQRQPIGTVVILHGIRDRKESQLGFGRRVRSLGYRVLLLDLRGHGLSTGDYLTYGALEGRDVHQVINHLSERRLLAEPVAAIGFSYGGAVAIQAAAADPRITKVVSVATFASLEKVIASYIRKYLPVVGTLITAGRRIASLRKAGEMAGFNPDDADTAAAARRTRASILLIHGSDDDKVPPEHARDISSNCGPGARLVIVPGEDHDSIMGDSQGVLGHEVTRWLGRRN